MDKITQALITLVAVGIIGFSAYMIYQGGFDGSQDAEFFEDVANFEECIEEGNPAMESYPRQCIDKEGNHFVEDIGNELQLQDQIMIYVPRPGATIKSPLTIEGEALGSWFQEGGFEILLLDKDGDEIASATADVKGNWDNDQFVPFLAQLEFFTIEDTGSLIFNSQLRVPVKIEF